MKYVQSRYLLLLSLALMASVNLQAAEVNAVLDWSDKRSLGTLVSGKVEHVHVRPGMQVKAGDVLVELDQRAINLRQTKARAQVEHARLQKEEALREQERAVELFDRTVLSVYE